MQFKELKFCRSLVSFDCLFTNCWMPLSDNMVTVSMIICPTLLVCISQKMRNIYRWKYRYIVTVLMCKLVWNLKIKQIHGSVLELEFLQNITFQPVIGNKYRQSIHLRDTPFPVQGSSTSMSLAKHMWLQDECPWFTARTPKNGMPEKKKCFQRLQPSIFSCELFEWKIPFLPLQVENHLAVAEKLS